MLSLALIFFAIIPSYPPYQHTRPDPNLTYSNKLKDIPAMKSIMCHNCWRDKHYKPFDVKRVNLENVQWYASYLIIGYCIQCEINSQNCDVQEGGYYMVGSGRTMFDCGNVGECNFVCVSKYCASWVNIDASNAKRFHVEATDDGEGCFWQRNTGIYLPNDGTALFTTDQIVQKPWQQMVVWAGTNTQNITIQGHGTGSSDDQYYMQGMEVCLICILMLCRYCIII